MRRQDASTCAPSVRGELGPVARRDHSGIATIGGKASRDWIVGIARTRTAIQHKRAITMADRLGLSAADLGSMYDAIEDGEVRATLIQQLASNGTHIAQDKLVSIAKNNPLVSIAMRDQAGGSTSRVKDARELVGK
jgi:hypothetical protein